MNAIEFLNSILAGLFPAAERKLSRPVHEDGFWSLDVRLGDYHLVIDWRQTEGFTLTSDPDHGYGEAADEAYDDLATASLRVITLLQHQLDTVPPYQVRIRELREKLGVSQTELATRMGIKQAAVSKLESREDTHVATLQSYIQSLGGRLVLRAVFADRSEEIVVGTG